MGAGAGTAAAAAVKASVGFPPLQILAIVESVAGVTAAGKKIGLNVGTAISKIANIKG